MQLLREGCRLVNPVVLIEWVNTGRLNGTPIELYGADRYTLQDGRAMEGYAYFDPRPFLAERPPAADSTT